MKLPMKPSAFIGSLPRFAITVATLVAASVSASCSKSTHAKTLNLDSGMFGSSPAVGIWAVMKAAPDHYHYMGPGAMLREDVIATTAILHMDETVQDMFAVMKIDDAFKVIPFAPKHLQPIGYLGRVIGTWVEAPAFVTVGPALANILSPTHTAHAPNSHLYVQTQSAMDIPRTSTPDLDLRGFTWEEIDGADIDMTPHQPLQLHSSSGSAPESGLLLEQGADGSLSYPGLLAAHSTASPAVSDGIDLHDPSFFANFLDFMDTLQSDDAAGDDHADAGADHAGQGQEESGSRSSGSLDRGSHGVR